MTLPTDIILPLRPEQIKAGGSELELYIRDLVNSLTDSYQDVVGVVNGSLKQWTPTVYGFTTAGSAGAYTRQTGWYLRQGLMVDLWFDIEWTGHTGVGALVLQLPYKAAKTENFPWMDAVFTTLPLTAGYSSTLISANSDTTQGIVLQSGSGVPFINVLIGADGRLTGHMRYVGQQFEN